MSLLTGCSALLNATFILTLLNVVRGRGGVAYLRAVLFKDNEVNLDPGLRVRRRIFASLPSPANRPIVFLGDSLTAACEWPELGDATQPILNRGIGGDTSKGVLQRISEICDLNPLALFLMVGANDPQMLRYSPAESCATIRAAVQSVLQTSPDCRIFIQSILPSRTPKFVRWSEETNALLVAFCRDWKLEYLNLRASFMDSNGLLRADFTYDGLHLTAEGYQVWRRHIEEPLQELRICECFLTAPAA